MMDNAVRLIQKEPAIWGPVFLLCTLTLAARIGVPYDLLIVALGGFFLSAYLQIRGCCYAWVFLALVSIVRHSFLISDHLWSLGVESSLAIAFFITALAFENKSTWIRTLQTQIETGRSAVSNLEESLAKVQEDAQNQQIAFQQKADSLQKEIEELQDEHSSILILNEVLRKTTARHIQEVSVCQERLYETQLELEQMRKECGEFEEEIRRLKDSDLIVAQNITLMKELNQARYDKEQTHLINETLARLHMREAFKAKDAETELESLKQRLKEAQNEVRRIEEPLKLQLAEAKKEAEYLRFEFEKSNQEANKAREEVLKLHEIQAERRFLKERLDAAMLEMETLKNRIDPEIAAKLKAAEERIRHLSQVDCLFKQLKTQFEEKNRVLHQARADLFRSETELEKIKIEMAALQNHPIPQEVEKELVDLGYHLGLLEEENDELQDLVTFLTNDSQDKRKKKLKALPPFSEQSLLF